ncbi:hypothetical protein BH10ACI4_BH10ACI4_26460 [soil metagenome]
MIDSTQKQERSLPKLASLFVAIFIVSLGLCGYSTHTGQEFGGTLGFFSLIGMAISFVCLLATGLVIIFRAIRSGYYK